MRLILTHSAQVPHDDLLDFDGAETALDEYYRTEEGEGEDDEEDEDSPRPVLRQSARVQHRHRPSYTTLSGLIDSSDEDIENDRPAGRSSRRRPDSSRGSISNQSRRRQKSQLQFDLISNASDSSGEVSGRKLRRKVVKKRINYSGGFQLPDDESGDSDEPTVLGKRKRRGGHRLSPPQTMGARRSGRNVRSGNMRELGEDEIPMQATTGGIVKFVGAKEKFKKLPPNDDFRLRHSQFCDTCNDYGDTAERGQLVYCQGCALSYHQKCLGPRHNRDHLVTKIADGDFVLQCRRCISHAKHKDSTAPDQSKCLVCRSSSEASKPFRGRKTIKQEQRDREENGGQDPVTTVTPEIINNPGNVFFRCLECTRACHFHHLPPLDGQSAITDLTDEHVADERFAQYCKTWTCKDCKDATQVIDSLVAWRPYDVESFQPGTVGETVSEDDKEYLIKWKQLPYSLVTWMPGAWVWGVTSPHMRKAFHKRDQNVLPKFRTEDAVPEDFHRVDIVFDIKYANVVKVHTVEVDQARIKEVEQALVKFKALGYEDVVWVKPPRPDEQERWEDFKMAYNDWVMGSHVQPLPSSTLSHQLSKLRSRHFQTSVKLDAQPESLSGGEVMSYQLDGINWLYYQWFRKQNAILADEMGLGKTIQIIGFLTTLVQRHNCYPFLVVVPNSTCPNWRREIKKWAPSVRVVTYYGSSEARKLSQKYELFPGGAKELRCHIVVTSYDAAQDMEFRKVFRGVHWAGLVVDEGQRLKNDKNILYSALNALRIPFKVLLTGK